MLHSVGSKCSRHDLDMAPLALHKIPEDGVFKRMFDEAYHLIFFTTVPTSDRKLLRGLFLSLVCCQCLPHLRLCLSWCAWNPILACHTSNVYILLGCCVNAISLTMMLVC